MLIRFLCLCYALPSRSGAAASTQRPFIRTVGLPLAAGRSPRPRPPATLVRARCARCPSWAARAVGARRAVARIDPRGKPRPRKRGYGRAVEPRQAASPFFFMATALIIPPI